MVEEDGLELRELVSNRGRKEMLEHRASIRGADRIGFVQCGVFSWIRPPVGQSERGIVKHTVLVDHVFICLEEANQTPNCFQDEWALDESKLQVSDHLFAFFLVLVKLKRHVLIDFAVDKWREWGHASGRRFKVFRDVLCDVGRTLDKLYASKRSFDAFQRGGVDDLTWSAKEEARCFETNLGNMCKPCPRCDCASGCGIGRMNSQVSKTPPLHPDRQAMTSDQMLVLYM